MIQLFSLKNYFLKHYTNNLIYW